MPADDSYTTSSEGDSVPSSSSLERLYDQLINESFSPALKEDKRIKTALPATLKLFEKYTASTPFDNLTMKQALNIASGPFNEPIERVNRKTELRLCVEAAFILVLSNCKESSQLTLTEVEFLESYPDFNPDNIGAVEFKILFRFRNILKVALHVIPALGNKDHLLDISTRLVEGYTVRRVTGSGATPATRRRVEIILKEGDLVVPKRPPRRDSGASHARSSGQKRSVATSSSTTTARSAGVAGATDTDPSAEYHRKYKKRVRLPPKEPLEDDSQLVDGTLIEEVTTGRTRSASRAQQAAAASLLSIINQPPLLAPLVPPAAGTTAASGIWEGDLENLGFEFQANYNSGDVDPLSMLATTPRSLSQHTAAVSLSEVASSDHGSKHRPRASSINSSTLERSASGDYPPNSAEDNVTFAGVPESAGTFHSSFIIPQLVLSVPGMEMPQYARSTSDEWYEYPLDNTSVGCSIPPLKRFPSAPLH